MQSLLDELENTVNSVTENVDSIVESTTSLIIIINNFIHSINSMFLPITITLLCINMLNVGFIIWCVDRPYFDSYVFGEVNNGELYKEKNTGKKECKINVQYKVNNVRYDYTFITSRKDNYLNRDKLKIYYHHSSPNAPSLYRHEPKRGRILIGSSFLVSGVAWLFWWMF